MMKTVSVVIPVYNAEKHLGETLDSVLGQTFQDIEIIVVDDGSTDRSRAVAQGYAGRYGGRIRVFQQANSGPASARNFGIREATGHYIAFNDADDLWLPTKLEKQVAYFEHEAPDVGLVYARAKKFDQEGTWGPLWETSASPVKGWAYWDILKTNIIPNQSVVIRRPCFDEVGVFDESLDIIEDHDMWLRIAWRFKFGFVDEMLSLYCEHEGGRSKSPEVTFRRSIGVMHKHLALRSGNVDHEEKVKYMLAQRIFDLGYFFLKEGAMASARELFAQSLAVRYEKRAARMWLGTYVPYPILSMANKVMKIYRNPQPIEKSKRELEEMLETIAAARCVGV